MPNEYSTIDIAPEEDALRDLDKTDPIYKAAGLSGDSLSESETNRLLKEIIENQQKQIKQTKAIRSYAAFFTLLALIGIISAIISALNTFGIIK